MVRSKLFLSYAGIPIAFITMWIVLFVMLAATVRAANIGPQSALTFAPVVLYDAGYSPQSVAIGDLNGDGVPDLIVANQACVDNCAGEIGILLGNGDGTFQPMMQYLSGGWTAQSVAVADVNGDGKLDVLVANNCVSATNCNRGAVGVLLGDGHGGLSSATTYDSGGIGANLIEVADMNGDGHPDVVVANQFCAAACMQGGVGVLLGNGDGNFQPATTYSSGGWGAQWVAIGDLNGDHHPDLAVANFCGGFPLNCVVGVLLGNGDGTFQTTIPYASGGHNEYAVVIADANNDGKSDLVVSNTCVDSACTSEGTLSMLLGNGDGTFQPPVAISAGKYAGPTAAGDLDGDGNLDFAVVSCPEGEYCYGHIAVFLGNGDGSLQPAISYNLGGGLARSVAVGDLNGDGRSDLVLALRDKNEASVIGAVGVLLNQTGLTAPTTTTLVSSLNPVPLKAPVTYTATVIRHDGGAVTGSIQFRDAGVAVATIALVGDQAAYSTSYKSAVARYISAVYSGDADNSGSISATLIERISGGTPSRTVLTTSGSPSSVGQAVTFLAKVTSRFGAIPDGEFVTFYSGRRILATIPLSGGMAAYKTSELSAEIHTIRAIYAGDLTFSTSTGWCQQVVLGYATATTLTSSPNPSAYRKPVTFVVTVTSAGPIPTGTVRFLDGTIAIGTASLTAGIASLTKSSLTRGTHPITAQYNGDYYSGKSTSTVISQLVQEE